MKISQAREFSAATIAFLCGVFFILNLAVVSFGDKAVRVLDLVGLVSILFCFRQVFKTSFGLRYWIVLSASVVSFALVLFYSFLVGDVPHSIVIIRVVLSICSGIAAVIYCYADDRRRWLLLGMWFGSILGLGVSFGQSLGDPFFLSFIPPDATESGVLGVWRPSGIWGHPNAQAQVTLAGASMMLLVWKRSDNRLFLQLALYFTVASLNYYISENRAPLVVGGLVCFTLLVKSENIFMRLTSVFCLVAGGLVLLFAPSLVLSERWTGTFSGMSTADQAHERFSSTLAGIQIALQSPFGLAVADQKSKLLDMVGVGASHNGIVFFAMNLGPVVAVLSIFVLGISFLRAFQLRRRYFFTFAFLSLIGMLFFEDSTTEPSIVVSFSVLATLGLMSERKFRAERIEKKFSSF